jgi:uncharacterized protein (TIGR03435 family)
MPAFGRILTLVIAAVSLVTAQSSSPQQFEVATIKLSPPGGRGGGVRPSPGGERYVATNASLKMLITVAYRLRADQIAGGPGWMDTVTFDMNAKAEHASTVEELHTMLKNLLAERFQLQFHLETKELPVYVLTVDKSGPDPAKLIPHNAENAGEPWVDIVLDTQPGAFLHSTWHAKTASMDYFAFRLGLALDRPVIDQTGLTGGYDFDFAYTRDLPPGISEGAHLNGALIDTSGPTIFEAVRKLGLKLERQKGPVRIMVIDRAEKPVE